jgi:hypothetical protein
MDQLGGSRGGGAAGASAHLEERVRTLRRDQCEEQDRDDRQTSAHARISF